MPVAQQFPELIVYLDKNSNIVRVKRSTMIIRLDANIQKFNDHGFIGWVENFKGLVVSAETKEAVLEELNKSIVVKIAHDYGISADNINELNESEFKDLRNSIELIFNDQNDPAAVEA